MMHYHVSLRPFTATVESKPNFGETIGLPSALDLRPSNSFDDDEEVSLLNKLEGMLDGSVMIYKEPLPIYYNATGRIGDQRYA